MLWLTSPSSQELRFHSVVSSINLPQTFLDWRLKRQSLNPWRHDDTLCLEEGESNEALVLTQQVSAGDQGGHWLLAGSGGSCYWGIVSYNWTKDSHHQARRPEGAYVCMDVCVGMNVCVFVQAIYSSSI